MSKNKTQVKKNTKKQKSKFPWEYIIIGVILFITIITYSGSLKNPFMTSWDDNMHVVENHVITKLSAENIKIIFTPNTKYLYHPLTILSFAFEYSLVGLSSTLYHFDNLLLHLINIVLVFFFVSKLTKRKEIGLIATLIFALHPMQVEAVAWISERKDVLYAAFFLSAMIAYLKFTETKNNNYYYYALLLFIGSLLSKPAAVTLPVVLIAIDYFLTSKIEYKKLYNKIPFFILSLVFGIIPFLFQKSAGDIKDLATTYTLIDRFFLASYALTFYIIKFIAPYNLCALYYLPVKVNGWFPMVYYMVPLVILTIIGLVIWAYKKGYREIVFGSVFFVTTVSLVLQIIPIGRIITADRYTYIPFIGLSITLGYLLIRWQDQKRGVKNYIIGGILVYTLVFIIESKDRIRIWEDGMKLFTDVIEKNPEKPHAWAARAYAKLNANENEAAIEDYNKAIDLEINDAEAFNNRGNAKYNLKRYTEAMDDYNLSIKTNPKYPLPYYNRSQIIELMNQDYKRTIKDYDIAIKLDSNYMLAYNARGLAYYRLSDYKNAMVNIQKAIDLEPLYPNAWHNRGLIYFSEKKYPEAINDYTKAIELNPSFGLAYANRAVAKFYINQKQEACNDWQLALQQNYKDAETMIQTYCN